MIRVRRKISQTQQQPDVHHKKQHESTRYEDDPMQAHLHTEIFANYLRIKANMRPLFVHNSQGRIR